MTDLFLPPPIPPEFDRAAWHIAEREIRILLEIDGLTYTGLSELRRRLRSNEWTGAPADVQARRVLLLSDVCTAMGAQDGILDYYLGTGDIVGNAPADLSGIDDGPKPEPDWPPLPPWDGVA
ncbi:MAG: hypothetical protein M3N95_10830 [Actinomycetota bacterium]|nr:hypothetical protein [Actinomycetota bacterium]